MKKGSVLRLAAGLGIYALCFALNLGGAWMGDPAEWENAAATAVYVLLCTLFVVRSRGSKWPARGATLLSVLTLLGAVIALLARAPRSWIFTLPAIALTPFTAVPMYGLRCWLDWNGTYTLTALLGGLWLICLLWRKEKP